MGRAARVVGALMGAAALYDTLLSVCERLLKAFKSAARLQQVQLVFTARRTKAKRVQPQSSIITLRQRSGTRQHRRLAPVWSGGGITWSSGGRTSNQREGGGANELVRCAGRERS